MAVLLVVGGAAGVPLGFALSQTARKGTRQLLRAQPMGTSAAAPHRQMISRGIPATRPRARGGDGAFGKSRRPE
jgi:hypothetical protein